MSPLQIILAFATLHLGVVAPLPGIAGSPGASAVATIGLFAGVWVAFHLWAASCRRAIERGRGAAIRAADRGHRVMRWGVLAALAVGVGVFGWLEAVRTVVGDLPVIDEVIALLPWAGTLSLGYFSLHPIERRVREAVLLRMLDEGRPVHPFPRRWAFVWRSMRQHVLFVALPLVLLVGWGEAVAAVFGRAIGEGIVGWRLSEADATWAEPAAHLAGVALLFVVMPEVLRRVWETRPLAPGELRDDLLAVCREAGVRVRDVLLWRTDGLIANGAVMGLLAPLRYVVLTDALLESLTRDELRAVMAHEAGHVRRHHMAWLGLAVVAVSLLAAAPAAAAVGWTAWLFGAVPQGVAAEAVSLLLVLGPALLVVGAVSRRFERQADAFAVQTLSRMGGSESCVVEEASRAMRRALSRVAALNGLPVRRFTWRHGSIAGRQRAIAMAAGQPLAGLPADAAARRVKMVVACALAVGVLILVLLPTG